MIILNSDEVDISNIIAGFRSTGSTGIDNIPVTYCKLLTMSLFLT